MTAARLVTALRAARFACLDEADLQAGVERLLAGVGIGFVRERRLSARDRVDFWLPESGTALELKVKTDPSSLLRQVLRYAEHPDVRDIVAASTTHHVLQLPGTVNGKPLHKVQLMRW